MIPELVMAVALQSCTALTLCFRGFIFGFSDGYIPANHGAEEEGMGKETVPELIYRCKLREDRWSE